jgi:thioredoxin-like negative regulator of GroEL
MTINQALDHAVVLRDAGRESEAERVLLQILAQHPRQPVALHMLAAIAGKSGRLDRAVQLLTQLPQFNR